MKAAIIKIILTAVFYFALLFSLATPWTWGTVNQLVIHIFFTGGTAAGCLIMARVNGWWFDD